MSDPKTLDELNARFMQNQKISGFGIGNVHVSVPCPFCAAPDFMKYELLECEKVMAEEHVCSECHRGAKTVFKRDEGGIRFEVVQTRGDSPPDYLPPIRRV